MIFDRYVTIDWSACNRPNTGKDSIWVCDLGAEGEASSINPRTRRAAEAAVRDLLVTAVQRSERVLVGFDFPYAYPRGFAGALGLDGPPWRAIWQYLCGELRDDAENKSNRFQVAATINEHLGRDAFWGRPVTQEVHSLSPKKDRVAYWSEAERIGLREWREVERVLRENAVQPKSAWQLLGRGAVGSQALTGIPVVWRLRADAALAGVSHVWPFEGGVPDVAEGRAVIVHAEIWPSLIAVPRVADQIRDQTQVIQLAKKFRETDRAGLLATWFAAAESPESKEEGWILGVLKRTDQTRVVITS